MNDDFWVAQAKTWQTSRGSWPRLSMQACWRAQDDHHGHDGVWWFRDHDDKYDTLVVIFGEAGVVAYYPEIDIQMFLKFVNIYIEHNIAEAKLYLGIKIDPQRTSGESVRQGPI